MSIFKLAIWDFVGRLANYAVTFVVSVILTRLLTPREYGVYGIVIAVTSFAGLFIDSGFRLAIIQSKEVTQEQLSTVFYFSLLTAFALMVGTVGISGIVERFYGIENLSFYLSIISLNYIVSGLSVIPITLIQKQMRLKTISIVNTMTPLVSGAIAIPLALQGFGVWALIVQPVVASSVALAVFGFLVRWRPSLEFSFSSIYQLWKYGSRVLLVSIIDLLFGKLDILLIGKYFSVSTLGLYNRAKSLDVLVRDFSSRTTVSVAFPLFSRLQDEHEQLLAIYSRSLGFISFAAFFIIGNLFIVATDLVVILFTEKWIGVVVYFRLFLLVGFAYPVGALMQNLVNARGDAGRILKLSITKNAILAPTFIPLVMFGVIEFLIARSFGTLANVFVNMAYVKKELEVSIWKQWISIIPYGANCVGFGLLVFASTSSITSHYLHGIASSALFSALYLGTCHLLGLEGYEELRKRLTELMADLGSERTTKSGN